MFMEDEKARLVTAAKGKNEQVVIEFMPARQATLLWLLQPPVHLPGSMMHSLGADINTDVTQGCPRCADFAANNSFP